jgi:hypothetical protein
VAALHHARDAAERGGVHDQLGGRLDGAGGVAVGDVERDQAGEAGVADGDDIGMLGEPLGDHLRCLRLSPDACVERLQPAGEEPRGIGRGGDAGARAEGMEVGEVLAGDCAEERVVVAAEVLRDAVQDEVGAVLEWP